MDRRRPRRPRVQRVPLRQRVGRSYEEMVAAGDTSYTHLPWDIVERVAGPDTWVLCVFGCERAYQLREAKWVADLPGEVQRFARVPGDGLWYCAYFPECDDDAVFHAWPWEDALAQGRQGPVIPVRGVRYPLYPSRWE